jgi:hypothetical protein
VTVIDSHIHCGIQNTDLPFETVLRFIESGDIQGACLFAPVEDIYDRYDYRFKDTPRWAACRQMANEYLLDIQRRRQDIFAYFFVWNDFRKEELKKGYKGVKWHRHTYEPEYDYESPLCEEFLQEVYRLRLPIVLEESFENTRYFVRRVAAGRPSSFPTWGVERRLPDALRLRIWDERPFMSTRTGLRPEIKTFLNGTEARGSSSAATSPSDPLPRVSDGAGLDLDGKMSKTYLTETSCGW